MVEDWKTRVEQIARERQARARIEEERKTKWKGKVEKIAKERQARAKKERDALPDTTWEREPSDVIDVSDTPSLYESEGWKLRDKSRVIPKRVDTVEPPPEPRWSGRGGTATVEQLREVGVPQKGIVPIGLPTPSDVREREMEGDIGRAEYFSRERTEERVGEFEEQYEPMAQDLTQQTFNALMNQKARELGMQRIGGQWYYTTESQKERFEEYMPVAQEIAIVKGQSFYSQQWESQGVEGDVSDIYMQEFEKQGFVLVEGKDGMFNVVPVEEHERKERYELFKEKYEKKEYESPVEMVGHVIELAGAYLGNPELLFQAVYGRATGDEKTVTTAESKALFQMEEVKKEGVTGVIKELYGPGSLPFNIALAYGGGALIGGAVGVVKGVSPMVAKGGQAVLGGMFVARTTAEVSAIVKHGRPVKWGGFLGLVPVGVKYYDEGSPTRQMADAERFASLVMFGTMAVAGIKGYKKGTKLGQSFIKEFYTPKYVYGDISKTFLRPFKRTDKGISYKGMTTQETIRTRTIFGREIPWAKDYFGGKAEVTGFKATEDTLYYDPKLGIWKPMKAGQTRFTMGKGEVYHEVMGLKVTRAYLGKDTFTGYPSRGLVVKKGKELSIDIQPFSKKIPLGILKVTDPVMSLILSKKALTKELFKKVDESKFFPSETSTGIKAVTQLWKLPDEKSIMKVPKLEPIDVKYFTRGEMVKVKGQEKLDTTDYLGFTYKQPSKPEVFVRDPMMREKPWTDMFDRMYKREGMITPIIRHELIHRIMPSKDRSSPEKFWFDFRKEEFIVQAVSQKKRVPEWYPEYQKGLKEFGLSDKYIKTLHGIVKPKLDKAVKNYWETGKLQLKEQVGEEVFELTPFRKVFTVDKTYGKGWGMGKGIVAVLKGTEVQKGLLEPLDLKTWIAGGKTQEKILMQTTGGPQRTVPETITIDKRMEIAFPHIDFIDIWGDKTLFGYLAGGISATALQPVKVSGVKPQTEMDKMMQLGQKPINKQINEQIQRLLQGRLPGQIPIQGDELSHRQLQAQTQIQQQLEKMLTQQVSVSVSAPTMPTITFPLIPLPIDLTAPPPIPGMNFNQAYEVRVKHRTYRKGKRIRPDNYDITLGKYGFYDGKAVGGSYVDANEKASFILVPVEGKPRKRPSGVKNWFTMNHEFFENKKGQIVERVSSRIDSPGELEAITFKGIEARKGKSKGSKIDRSFEKVNKVVDTTIKRYLKKAGGF